MRPRRVQFTIAPVVVAGLVLLAGVAGSGSANLRIAPPIGWGDDDQVVVGETPTSAIGVQEQTLKARHGASSTAITLGRGAHSLDLTEVLGAASATEAGPGSGTTLETARASGDATTDPSTGPGPTATSRPGPSSGQPTTTTRKPDAPLTSAPGQSGGSKGKNPKADTDASTPTTRPGKTPDTAPGRTTTTTTTPAPPPSADPTTTTTTTTTATTAPEAGDLPGEPTTTTRPGRRVGQQDELPATTAP